MLVVRITDEFNTVWESVCKTNIEAVSIVSEWLENRYATPIIGIRIDVDPLEYKDE
jgi:hypothetical protein